MPVFSIDLGDSAYSVEAETPEEAHAAVSQVADTGPQPTGIDATTMYTRGASLGASDYVGAGARYAGDMIGRGARAVGLPVNPNAPIDESFNDALKGVRGDVHDYRDQHPMGATVAELGGALGTAGPNGANGAYAGIAKAVDAGLSKVPYRIPDFLRYSAQGMAAGGFAGLIGAEGSDRGLPSPTGLAAQGTMGTIGGGVIGAGAPYLGKAAGYGLGKVGDVMQGAIDKLPFRQDTVAGRKIAENLARDGVGVDDLIANRDALGRGANLVDAAGSLNPQTGVWIGGKNTFRQADALANMPGKTQDIAERVLKPRASQAATDLIKSVETNLSPNGFYDTLDSLSAQKMRDASPLYEAANDKFKNLSSPFLANMAENPLIQSAAREGERGAMIEAAVTGNKYGGSTQPMFEFNSAGDPQVSGSWSLEQWDTVKKGLDRSLNNMRDTTTGKLPQTQDVRDLVSLKSALVSHLDNLTTVDGKSMYGAARQAWAGPSALQDAMWTGRDFMRGDREMTVAAFQKLSPVEKDAFRDGVAREIKGAIEQSGTVPTRLRNIMNPENGTRKVLQAIFPDAKSYGQFQNDVSAVIRKGQTARMIGGSDTAARFANQADLGSDLGGAAINAAHGNVGSAAMGVLRGVSNWAKAPSEGARDAMGSMLLNPASFDNAIGALRSRASVPAYGLPRGLLDISPAPLAGLLGSRITGRSNQ